MKIHDVENDRHITSVGLALTLSEASELRDTLTTLMAAAGGRHEHVPAFDYSREITVWIDEPDGPPRSGTP